MPDADDGLGASQSTRDQTRSSVVRQAAAVTCPDLSRTAPVITTVPSAAWARSVKNGSLSKPVPLGFRLQSRGTGPAVAGVDDAAGDAMGGEAD